MNFRIDEGLLTILNGLGPVWFVVALGVLAYAAFGPILRGFGLTILLLVAAQCWYTPAFLIGRNLRWWVLLLVCARGILASFRIPRPPGEKAGGRSVALALGLVAIASCLWSDQKIYTLGVAASFVLSLVIAFVVLWSLYDAEDLLAGACRGAAILGLLVFGSSYLWYLQADATNDMLVLRAMGAGGRFSGVMFNANMMGILAMTIVPALVAAPRSWLGAFARLRWPVIAVSLLALYMSGSRSALIGTGVALLILFLFRFGAGALLTVAIASVGIYVLVTSSAVEDIDATAVGHITRTKHIHTLSGRLELWEEGLDAIQGRQLVGLGWGNSRLLQGADPDAALEKGHVSNASNLHSTHIQILVDVGILGLGLLWAFSARVLLAGWTLLRSQRTERSTACVMVLACFVSALADSFVHGSVLSTGSPSALIFWSSAVIVLKEADRIRRGVVVPVTMSVPAMARPA